jgi:hypothetical protein
MTLEREWEKFTGGPASGSSDSVRVTLNRRGLIYMNTKAYSAIGRPKAVALFYNREADAIAVQPAYPRFEQNFQVVKKQNGWAIHASPFCRHFRIAIPNTERFIRPDLDKEGNLILNLRETVTVGGIEKRRRAAGPKAGQNRER